MDRETGGTPSKPPGILLTPGTGTSKRKRVTFGHGLESNAPSTTTAPAPNSDDDWEEEESDHINTDVTLDLNEPHSNSGRYWKEEYQKYHDGAKAEMEKLLKYKQLAKTYAQQKDTQVTRLAERLREEQSKVAKLQQMLAQTSQETRVDGVENDANSGTAAAIVDLTKELEKQTVLATEYRDRAEDLEDKLEDALASHKALQDRRSRPVSDSPGSQKALIEVQRELRKARTEVTEMSSLREQLATLKAQLQLAKSADAHTASEASSGPRARDLRTQLRTAQAELNTKAKEVEQLKEDMTALKTEADKRDDEMRDILQRAQSKITELKRENKSLKSIEAEHTKLKSLHAETLETIAAAEKRANGISSRPQRRHRTDEKDSKTAKSTTLREKYQQDSATEDNDIDLVSGRKHRRVSSLPAESDARGWQPFVPRTPRDRHFLRDDIANHLQDISTTPAGEPLARHMNLGRERNSSKVKSSRSKQNAAGDDDIDLLQHRFAKLGGPEVGAKTSNVARSALSRSALGAERHAAVLARIDKRVAEKKKARARYLIGKENLRP